MAIAHSTKPVVNPRTAEIIGEVTLLPATEVAQVARTSAEAFPIWA